VDKGVLLVSQATSEDLNRLHFDGELWPVRLLRRRYYNQKATNNTENAIATATHTA